jgi:hypothetical protein
MPYQQEIGHAMHVCPMGGWGGGEGGKCRDASSSNACPLKVNAHESRLLGLHILINHTTYNTA